MYEVCRNCAGASCLLGRVGQRDRVAIIDQEGIDRGALFIPEGHSERAAWRPGARSS